jgi:hypothetical protein
MFSDDAAPTRANLKKRLDAADEALRSAFALQRKRDDDDVLLGVLSAGVNQVTMARGRLAAAKGKRS